VSSLGGWIASNRRNPNAIAYTIFIIAALLYPTIVQFSTGGNGD